MKYLKFWNESLENSKIQVKIITPKVAENRQKSFWYDDGVVIAEVTDGTHTIYIDNRGESPSKQALDSPIINDDYILRFNSNFYVEYWQNPSGYFYTISDSGEIKYVTTFQGHADRIKELINKSL